MTNHSENCMVCGKELIYSEAAEKIACYFCDARHITNVVCEDGHYVCDDCHAGRGLSRITRYSIATSLKDPIKIATEMMRDPDINMHGPEHHYLVVAALLAAYKNARGEIDFIEALRNAKQRATEVPGGICGMWGSCGAGIATGIFISVVTGATPLSEEEWSFANRMTSNSLDAIAENGGPRCCKRNTYLAIFQAAAYAKEIFDITMELPEQVVCGFFERNSQCRKEKCLYYGPG